MITKPFISAEEIQKICKSLGAQITKDYQNKNLVLICVLKGSFVFTADLMRHIDVPHRIEFVRLSSYGQGTVSSGHVKVLMDLDGSVEGMDVVVVEDILDTGNTLQYFKKYLESRKPASIKLCVFLDKPSRRQTAVQGDYVGKVIEDKFVVGYGLDYQEKFRHLPEVRIVES